MPMVEGNFAALLAPGLDRVFHTAYNELPERWSSFFRMNSSSKAYEEHASWAGFEPFQSYGELEDIQLREAKMGYTVRYVHRKWGLGYQLSQELVDDNLYSGVLESFPAMLARSGRATKEATAATIFNMGFSASQPGGDGKALFATDHPLAGNAGGVSANTFGTGRDLSHQAIKDAIQATKRTLADDGILAPWSPSILLVPDALEPTAREILGTDRVPYSADNTTNILTQEGLSIVAWPYLTDDDAWYLLAPSAQTELHYFERWPLKQLMKDREENQSMIHLAYSRYSFGFSDWRGVFGVSGV